MCGVISIIDMRMAIRSATYGRLRIQRSAIGKTLIFLAHWRKIHIQPSYGSIFELGSLSQPKRLLPLVILPVRWYFEGV
jgi:hypothetical protein